VCVCGSRLEEEEEEEEKEEKDGAALRMGESHYQ